MDNRADVVVAFAVAFAVVIVFVFAVAVGEVVHTRVGHPV